MIIYKYNVKEEKHMDKTVKILRKCHLNSKYKGYLYIQDSVDIIISCIENDKTTYITKDIYPVIAHRYNSTISSVEAAIRHAIYRCWNDNKSYVCEILGYDASKCPSNAEFLNALALYSNYDD